MVMLPIPHGCHCYLPACLGFSHGQGLKVDEGLCNMGCKKRKLVFLSLTLD